MVVETKKCWVPRARRQWRRDRFKWEIRRFLYRERLLQVVTHLSAFIMRDKKDSLSLTPDSTHLSKCPHPRNVACSCGRGDGGERGSSPFDDNFFVASLPA